MGWLSDPALQWTLALLLAGMWATAAWGKLAHRDAFRGMLHNYRMLPEAVEAPVATALPVLELLVALSLLLPPLRAAAAVASALLLLLFATAMAINILRGRTEIDCGCFVGATRQRIGWSLVVRNLLLALAALVLILPGGDRPLSGFDLFTIGAASSALLMTYLALARVLELAPPAERRA